MALTAIRNCGQCRHCRLRQELGKQHGECLAPLPQFLEAMVQAVGSVVELRDGAHCKVFDARLLAR